MTSRLICSKHGIVVFTVGFSFYFFMKYYLIAVSVRYDDELHLSTVSDAVGSTPMTTRGPVTAINISFDLLFGNGSCQADVLGTPPFVRAAGCNNSECSTITCKRLLVGDNEAVEAAVKFTNTHERKAKKENEVLTNALNCEEFRKRGGYRRTPVRPSDSEFPIAFSILVHWHLEQFERLLRAIYRPQNVYCIHIDTKTSRTFHSAVVAIAQCLDNVYIATRPQLVVYAGFSRLQVRSCFFRYTGCAKKVYPGNFINSSTTTNCYHMKFCTLVSRLYLCSKLCCTIHKNDGSYAAR